MKDILYSQDGPVATVTFNRPEARNALTWEMYAGLEKACETVDTDPTVKVLVLRGAGGHGDGEPDHVRGGCGGAACEW